MINSINAEINQLLFQQVNIKCDTLIIIIILNHFIFHADSISLYIICKKAFNKLIKNYIGTIQCRNYSSNSCNEVISENRYLCY
jgi:hypothetical protein